MHSTTSRFRSLVIVPLLVTALAIALLAAAAAASPALTRPAEAAVAPAGASVVKALTAKANTTRTRSGKAVRVALAQRGDPYRWGGDGPNAFDCSGLTSYAWKKAGKVLPRTSTAQRGWTRTIPYASKRAGDLLFYSGHVSMYVGKVNGRHWMIHAPRRGQPVQVVPIRTAGLLKVGRVG